MARQLVELVDEVGLRGEGILAAARRLAGLGLDAAVAIMHLDPHLVPELRTERGDGRIVPHLHLAGELDAALVGHAGLVELLDEDIAFEQQRGDAERQIELRRGQPSGR